jgi:hypothetical protein
MKPLYGPAIEFPNSDNPWYCGKNIHRSGSPASDAEDKKLKQEHWTDRPIIQKITEKGPACKKCNGKGILDFGFYTRDCECKLVFDKELITLWQVLLNSWDEGVDATEDDIY